MALATPTFFIWSGPAYTHNFWGLANVYPLIRPYVNSTDSAEECAINAANLINTYLNTCKNSDYGIYIQNIGSSSTHNTSALMNNHSDAVAGSINGDDAIFFRNGSAANKTWANSFFSYLRTSLAQSNQRGPIRLHNDYEPPCSLCTTFGPDGWFTLALADARSSGSIELIDGIHNLATVYANRLDIYGNSFTYTDAQVYFHSLNRAATSWYLGVYYKAVSTALDDCLDARFRINFPGAKTSNYECYCTDSTNFTYALSNNTWFKNYNVPTIFQDLQAIPLYPPYNSGDMSTWITQFGVSTAQEAFRAHAMHNINSCVRASSKPVVPWLPYLNWSLAPAGTNYTVTKEDILYLIKECMKLGITEFILWTDYNGVPLDSGMTNLEGDTYKAIVEEANRYYNELINVSSPATTVKYAVTDRDTLRFFISQGKITKKKVDWEFKKGNENLYSFKCTSKGVVYKNNVLYVYSSSLNSVEVKLDLKYAWKFRCREDNGPWTTWETIKVA